MCNVLSCHKLILHCYCYFPRPNWCQCHMMHTMTTTQHSNYLLTMSEIMTPYAYTGLSRGQAKIHILRQKHTNYPAPIHTTATVHSESQNTMIFKSPPAMSTEFQSRTKYKHTIYYILEEASTNLIHEKCDAPSLTPHTYIVHITKSGP